MRIGLGLRITQPQRAGGLPLDGLTAAAAYSTRRLRTAYTGPAIRVRRSSDNVEADIGFTTAGDLDTAALLAHVQHGGPGPGNEDGFVTAWYDQSGNGRNATETTAARQPRIVDAGVVEVMSGTSRAAVRFVSTTGMRLSTVAFTSIEYSQAIAYSIPAAPSTLASLTNRGNITATGAVYMNVSRQALLRMGGTATTNMGITPLGAPNVITGYLSNAVRRGKLNAGSNVENTTLGTQAAGTLGLFIGAIGTYANPLDGHIGEVIHFEAADITTNGVQDPLHGNLRNHWGA